MNAYPFTLTPPSSNEDSPQTFTMNSPNYIYQTMQTPTQYVVGVNPYEVQMNNIYSTDLKPRPYLTITEQPIDKFRFRYKSEMAGTHGSLTGINSDKTRKQTYPSVKIHNFFDQEAVIFIRCSLYQHGSSDDRQPHAHRLIKKQGQDELDDPHDMRATAADGFEASFHSMGIIHTAKKHIVGELKRKKTLLKTEDIARKEKCRRSLTKKEEVEIVSSADEECKSINLNIVCLRFDAFKKEGDIMYPLCRPVYSHAINNLKSALTGELKIVRMDHSSSPAKGNREIFMLVEKVTKKNIKIRFFEMDEDDNEIWSEYGKFNDLDVHHQYAIVFRTPAYKDLDLNEQKKVFIELERPSDGSKSEPREFTYTPSQSYRTGVKRPRNSTYSSAEYSSGSHSFEIPATVEALQNIGYEVTSEELAKALPAINSDEFKQLFIEHKDVFNGFNSLDLLSSSPLPLPLPIAMDSEKNNATTKESNNNDKEIVARVYNECYSFLKSNPNQKHVCGMLNKLFAKHVNEAEENALHITVLDGNVKLLRYFLNLINTYKLYNILNMKNNNGETIVHLALQQQNVDVITTILTSRCDLNDKDNNGNTPLHIAIKQNQSILVIDTLLRVSPGTNLFVNAENNDNLTAMHMSVKMNKVKYVDILHKYRADVNVIDKKTGRNSLHIAITEQATEIVKLLLEKTNIDLLKEDFGGFTPLKMAKHLIQNNEPERIQIFNMIEKILIDKGLHTECIVKEEMESEEEMDVELVECKIEKFTSEELEAAYNNVTNFNLVSLEEVSNLLDSSGNWLALANLLDLEHILHTDMFLNAKSKSKELLKVAVRLGDLYNIRNFLDNLAEGQAVSIMDNMVMSMKMEM